MDKYSTDRFKLLNGSATVVRPRTRSWAFWLAAAIALPAASQVNAATPTLYNLDVGSPSLPGTMTIAGGKITIVGGGNDIWNTSDNFHYAYFKATGDFDYIVKVEDLQGPDNWTKAELMARLDDGSGAPQGGDPHISNMATRSAGQNELGPQWRVTRDGASDWRRPIPTARPTYPNTWLRMERLGSVFYLYYSTDGKNWTMYQPTLLDTAGSSPPGADNASSFNQAWPTTILFGLAVTAHNDADPNGGKAVFSNFDAHVAVPIAITTQPASTVSINANKPLVLTVAATGDPVHYQWRKDGTDIKGATAATYTVKLAQISDSGTYSARLFGAGKEVISASSVVTVTPDTEPPKIVSAIGSATLDSIKVTFSEPLDATTAQAAANYKLSGGITVSSATLSAAPNDNQVVLKTSKQSEGATLTLTVSNVKDTANNALVANSTFNFLADKFQTGWATYERWHNENGDPGNITAFADSITAGSIRPPDFSSAVTQFGAPWGARDNYSARVSGFFVPPSSGNFVFFTSSDDASNVYLSTDENPANKKLVAQETGWSNQYQWLTANGGGADTKRSDQFPGTEWPTGNAITLQAGKRYYIEALVDEGGGGDGVDVTFIKEGEADPATSTAGMRMRGSAIGTFLDPNGANVTIAQQPLDITGQENRTAKLSVGATGTSAYGTTVSYQWQKAPPGSSTFSDISGATASSYTTPVLSLADSGAKYRVALSVPTFSTQSSAATLTVVPDTFPPKLDGVGSLIKGTAVEIGLRFDESVEKVSASTAANFALSKGTVTGVRYQQFAHEGEAANFVVGTKGPFNGYAVVLTTSGISPGDTITVTAKNVKDLKGNAIAAAGEARSIKVTQKMKWAAMGGNDYVEGELGGGLTAAPDPSLWPDDAIASGDQDFDLVSGGTANWNNYDEATFVYEEVTGDFDKVVRVEYHDPTSQWARAGMAATPNADEGVTRAQVNGGYTMAKRYFLRANPAVQWNGSGGNNQFEADWRLTDGGNYGGTGAGTPSYPNAWMRMQRTGQTFTGFYSADGKSWTSYGAQTFTTEPMPDKLLVGIYYSPEMNNNETGNGVGHSSVAKFRQYGDFKVGGAAPGRLTVTWAKPNISITWEGDGTLQSAASVTGPWTDVGATKPYSTGATGQATYFRVKGQ